MHNYLRGDPLSLAIGKRMHEHAQASIGHKMIKSALQEGAHSPPTPHPPLAVAVTISHPSHSQNLGWIPWIAQCGQCLH